jgi:uncharacterized membrane protein
MARRKRQPSARRSGPRPPSTAVPEPADRAARVVAVDAARGIAIVAMIAYHFAFDLRHFGVTRSDFENDPFWLGARALIVTSFLLLVGVSLVLAQRAEVPWSRFARRVALIALCALAASVGSYLVYPQTYIYFGILHCIAFSLLLARPLARWPLAATALGVAVVIAGLTLTHPAFDARQLSWLGFTTRKPPTQDFVPMFPWLGVVMLGIGLGHALARPVFASIGSLARAPAALLWTGRHSLAVYMIHQPLMLGLIGLALRLGPG